jgi:hypothetical protein
MKNMKNTMIFLVRIRAVLFAVTINSSFGGSFVVWLSLLCFLGGRIFGADAINVDNKKIYPMEISVEVYPSDIFYGDICFGRFFATNKKDKPVYCHYGISYLERVHPALFFKDNLMQFFDSDIFDYSFEGFCQSARVNSNVCLPTQLVCRDETIFFHTQPLWVPLPELTCYNPPQMLGISTVISYGNNCVDVRPVRLMKTVNQEKKNFTFKFSIAGDDMPSYKDNNGIGKEVEDIDLSRQMILFQPYEILTQGELESQGYKLSESVPIKITQNSGDTGASDGVYNLRYDIHIKPRPQKILDMINDWYLTLPSTLETAGSREHWTGHGVFSHPHHTKNSPYNHGREDEKFQKFVESLRTRTPELLKRLKRTNELAAELLKLPDSELSQNMKEFIQLRGLLVDIRFAEDEKAEENAFNELITFVNKAKDKKLWIKFVGEIAFDSLHDDKYFPRKKIDDYRKRWIEKFEDKTDAKEVSKK